MGVYLNPGNGRFRKAVSSEIYVDKTGLLINTNKVLGTEQAFLCVSRPRRFGKSIAAGMIAAYYGRECDSKELFHGFAVEQASDFETYLNQYNVIFLNMQEFWSTGYQVDGMKRILEKSLLWDLLEAYPDFCYFDSQNLTRTLTDIFRKTGIPFVFVIDEWDCVFRESKTDLDAQKRYLDFLRNLLKDREYTALVYMTGILPVKKYGSHSALNMLDEYSMISPKQLAEYVGFTQVEVEELCRKYQMDFEEARRWYDGYCFGAKLHIYNPRSVVSAMLSRIYDNYWNQTETFEALREYIAMNYDGLKDMVIELLAGGRKRIDTGTFSNDMTTFSCAEDILTLFIHLGYLGYDFFTQEVFIPNSEVASEFINAIRSAGWDEIIKNIRV